MKTFIYFLAMGFQKKPPYDRRASSCNTGPLVAWYDHPDDKRHYRDTARLLYNGNTAPTLPDQAKINVVAIRKQLIDDYMIFDFRYLL